MLSEPEVGKQADVLAVLGLLIGFLPYLFLAVVFPRDRSWDDPDDYSKRYTLSQSF